MTTLLRRTGWALAGLAVGLLFQSLFRQPVALPLAIALAAFAAVAAWRPFTGLLLLAGLGPLAGVLMVLGRGTAGSIVLAEVLLLGFLTGWLLRQAVVLEPLQVPPLLRRLALLIALAAAASAIVHSARAAIEMGTGSPADLIRQTLQDYVLHLPGSEPLVAASGLAGGVLLLLAAAHLCAGRPERRTMLLRIMVCAAAGAAVLNIVRLVEVSLVRDDPLSAFAELFTTVRVNVHYTDRNAAGSYFAMLLLLACSQATASRWLFVATAPWIAAGLWISGSRFALASAAAAAVGGAIVAVWRASRRETRIAGALVAGLVLGLVGIISQQYPAGRNVTAARALSIRVDLARAGMQMAHEHPWFGVGLGRFYQLSDTYAGGPLAAAGFRRENAHNNFVQVLAELGAPGLAALLLLLASVFHQGQRAASTWEGRWLLAGLAAYLLTWLGGHPLLVPDAALPFWTASGAAAAAATLPASGGSGRGRHVAMVVGVLVVASIWPRAEAAMRDADMGAVSEGFSRWQEEDGTRYRWIGGRAAFYVDSSAQAFRLPVRAADPSRLPLEITILLDGREANRLRLQTHETGWRVLRVLLRPGGGGRFSRVDLLTGPPGGAPFAVQPADTGGVLIVGRPELEAGAAR